MSASTKSPLAIRGGTPVRNEPFPAWPVFGPEDEKALIDVLHSGRWYLGDRVEEVERAFAEFQSARYGVSVSSGTAALQVALEAAGVGLGDEVIVPAYTFVASASSIVSIGAIPVFVDVDPDTYCIDTSATEDAITENTAAIVAVHFAGHPADLDALDELAHRHGLRVIEDAAQAHAAEWKGRRVGAIADLGIFSFQASKNLNSGEGGFITSDDAELAGRAWSIHNCGRTREGLWYEHDLIGSNYRMSEFHAALILSQLPRLETQAQTRSSNATALTDRLSKIEGIFPLLVDERVTRHAYHLYVFRYDAESFGVPRQRFIEALTAEGIPCAPGYRPLYRETAFQSRFRDYPFHSPAFGGRPNYSRISLPVTERICADEAVWLTQNLLLGTEDDIEEIAEAVEKLRHHAHQLT